MCSHKTRVVQYIRKFFKNKFNKKLTCFFNIWCYMLAFKTYPVLIYIYSYIYVRYYVLLTCANKDNEMFNNARQVKVKTFKNSFLFFYLLPQNYKTTKNFLTNAIKKEKTENTFSYYYIRFLFKAKYLTSACNYSC